MVKQLRPKDQPVLTSVKVCCIIYCDIITYVCITYMFIGPCPKGHYSSDGNVPCDPCPIGYYQQFTGQTSCRKCLPGYTTTGTGMSSTLSCKRVTTQPPPTTVARTTAPPTTRTTAPPTTKATTRTTTARTTAPPTTKATTRPTTASTTAPPTAPPTPKGKANVPHKIMTYKLHPSYHCYLVCSSWICEQQQLPSKLQHNGNYKLDYQL